MKVYLFNSSSGVYEGEDFQPTASIDVDEGMTTVPPPPRQAGQVPVYDRDAGTWQLLPVTTYRKAGDPRA